MAGVPVKGEKESRREGGHVKTAGGRHRGEATAYRGVPLLGSRKLGGGCPRAFGGIEACQYFDFRPLVLRAVGVELLLL